MIVLRALGKAEIATLTDRLTPSQERLFAAALYLVIERPKPVRRETLAETLWPGNSDAPRQHRLRQMLHQLKRVGFPIRADRDTVTVAAADVESDLDVLFIHGAGDVDSLPSLQFLPGYAPAFSRVFSDWLDARRSEVSAASSRLLLNGIRRARSRGDWLRVERLALKCMDIDPFNEEAVLARAEASAMRGAKREAVSILDRYVADLGPGTADLKLPASLMRKRIAERVPESAFFIRTEGIFVGREADMQLLTVVLDDARQRRGRCCLVWGDAGIGKSRLVSELGRFGELQGVQVRHVACRRGDAQRPLSVFVEAVPQLREMRGALGCSPDTLADLQRLTQFDVTSTGRQALEMDPQSIFELIRVAILDLIDAVSEEQCLMLVVEDVHWIDPASARILGQIADWAANKQLMLVFTSRVRENPLLDACTRAGLITHHLLPISDEAATALVAEMFEATNETRDDEFLAWCRTVGDGNPFFLHELVKQWLETRQRHVIPPSITNVISDRFSRLGSEATQVLQACSILGENSTLPRVERMLQQEAYMLLGALNELSKASMLSAERKPAGPTGDFRLAARHDLVSVVAIEELDPHARVFLHRRAGEVLEAELGGETQDTSLLWACAQHWQKAGDEDRAYFLAKQCADYLLKMGLPSDAATALKRARAFCRSTEDEIAILLLEITALELAQGWTQLMEAIGRIKFLENTGAEHDDLEIKLLHATWRTSVDVTQPLQAALRCASGPELDPLHRAKAGCLAMKMASNNGDWATVDSVFESMTHILHTSGLDETITSELEMVYHAMRGDVRRTTELAHHFARSVRLTGDVNRAVRGLQNSADVYRLVGQYDKAQSALNEGIELAAAHRCHHLARWAALEVVRLNLEQDDIARAREEMNRFLDSPFVDEDPIAQAKFYSIHAQLLIAEHDIEAAEPICRSLLELSDGLPVPRQGYILALNVRLGVEKRQSTDTLGLLVGRLIENHLRFRGAGWQDYEAYSAYLGLCAINENRRARHLLCQYATEFRRDVSPLPSEIAKAI